MNNQMHTESALSGGSPTNQVAAAELQSGGAYRGSQQAAVLLQRLFRRYPGVLSLRLWDGTAIRAGTLAGPGSGSGIHNC